MSGEPLFELGRVVATRGAMAALVTLSDDPHAYAAVLLDRHRCGDWGDLESASDRRANDAAVRDGDRIVSAYRLGQGRNIRMLVITEWDRSVTTLLLIEEY